MPLNKETKPTKPNRDMRCHTNVFKSLRRVSLVQCTRRQARCLLQLLRYLLYAPLNVQVWHKAFLLVGPGTELEPKHAWHGQKYFQLRQHSSIRGASGVRQPSPKGSKSLGGRSPEAGRNVQLPKHTRPDPCGTAGQSVTQ